MPTTETRTRCESCNRIIYVGCVGEYLTFDAKNRCLCPECGDMSTPEFNRFDICAAHYQIEVDYNVNGQLKERPSNARRRESTCCQLRRMDYYDARAGEGFWPLNANARAIYRALERRYGFR